MTTPGLSATGFTAKTVDEIITDLQTSQAGIDPSLNTSSTGVLANLNFAFAQQLAQVWELGHEIFDAHDPDSAEGVAADHNGALSGVLRDGAKKSTVSLRLSLDDNGSVLTGSVVSQAGNPSVRFVTLEDALVLTAGDVTVAAEAETAGEINAAANTLTVMESPASGWLAVTNDAPAIAGNPVEPDDDYRVRRDEEVAAQGGSTVDGVVADVRQVVGVLSVGKIENITDDVVDTLPGHSFEIVVHADPGDEVDQAIADAIYKNKPAGAQTWGSTTKTVTDSEGAAHAVSFTRAVLVRVNVNYLVEFDDTYDSAHGVREAIEADSLDKHSQMYLDIGKPVYLVRMLASGLKAQGVVNLTLDIAKDPVAPGDPFPPVPNATIAIAARELGYFDHDLSWVSS